MATQIETLLAQFRHFLQQANYDPIQENSRELNEQSQHVDLFRLFVELEALKAEVKRGVRQQKEVMNRFTELVDTLQNNNQHLTQALDQQKEQQQINQYQAEQALLLNIIDLSDRLQATQQAMNREQYKPSWLERHFAKTSIAKTKNLYNNLQQGMDITLRRLNQLLESYAVTPIDAIGKRMNPHTMRVMEVRVDKKLDDGSVIEEVRQGYLRDTKVLRLADVVATRQTKQKE